MTEPHASIVSTHHAHARRDFQLSCIGSLVALILLFLLFPHLPREERSSIPLSPVIEAVDLMAPPPTRSNAPPPPPRPRIAVAEAPEIPILPDLAESRENTPLRDAAGSGSTAGTPESGTAAARRFAFVPRQVLEVLPESGTLDCAGSVTLSIVIGRDGKPAKHTVVASTIGSEACMQRVIDAVYASRWEPLPGDGAAETVRIRKTYAFE